MEKKLPTKLVHGLELIKKIDIGRWTQNIKTLNFFEAESLFAPHERILVHWLTYIFDYQMPAGVIWVKGSREFSYWVKEYRTKNVEQLEQQYCKISDHPTKIGKSAAEFTATPEEPFRPRYGAKDVKKITRTLRILENYDKNIANFIVQMTKKHNLKQDEKKFIKKIACCLYLLTYEKNAISEAQQILSDSTNFTAYYNQWVKNAPNGKKRLWAAFRDYIKQKELKQNLINSFIELIDGQELATYWNEFSQTFNCLNQLELPGDVWNQNNFFAEEFLKPLMEYFSIPYAKKTTSEIVRELCEKTEIKGLQIYPEQFDFTADPYRLIYFLQELKSEGKK